MAEYKLTSLALNDLSEIWNYTFDNWSESQADKYYDEILNECEQIAHHQFVGVGYEGVADALYGRKINRHVIFYRILSDHLIEITRILHERMDLKRRLDR